MKDKQLERRIFSTRKFLSNITHILLAFTPTLLLCFLIKYNLNNQSAENHFRIIFQAKSSDDLTPQKILIGTLPLILFAFLFSKYVSEKFFNNNIYRLIRYKSRLKLFISKTILLYVFSLLNTLANALVCFYYFDTLSSPNGILLYLFVNILQYCHSFFLLTILMNIINLFFGENLGAVANICMIVVFIFSAYIFKSKKILLLLFNPIYAITYASFETVTIDILICEIVFSIVIYLFFGVLVKKSDITVNIKPL